MIDIKDRDWNKTSPNWQNLSFKITVLLNSQYLAASASIIVSPIKKQAPALRNS